jgi:hypothetical protein
MLGNHVAVSNGGDKSSCCVKFLDEIVPFFDWVLLQDSIYFVQDFRNEVSQWPNVSSTSTLYYFVRQMSNLFCGMSHVLLYIIIQSTIRTYERW